MVSANSSSSSRSQQQNKCSWVFDESVMQVKHDLSSRPPSIVLFWVCGSLVVSRPECCARMQEEAILFAISRSWTLGASQMVMLSIRRQEAGRFFVQNQKQQQQCRCHCHHGSLLLGSKWWCEEDTCYYLLDSIIRWRYYFYYSAEHNSHTLVTYYSEWWNNGASHSYSYYYYYFWDCCCRQIQCRPRLTIATELPKAIVWGKTT